MLPLRRAALAWLALSLVPLATLGYGLTQAIDRGSTLTVLSVLAIGGASLLVAAIVAAGHMARGEPNLLLVIYGPLAVVTMAGLLVLVPLQGVLVLLVFFTPASSANAVFFFPVLAPAMLLVLLGTVGVLRACLMLLSADTISALATPITDGQEPEVWSFVRDVAQQVGTDPPEHLVAGLLPTFYVTEAPVRCVNRKVRGRTMHVSMPLVRILTQEELTAILGHELGHFKGNDTQVSQRFAPIDRAIRETASWLHEAIHRMTGAFMLWPPFLLTMLFLEAFYTAVSEIHRERELAADQEGARIVGITAAGVALVKVHALEEAWATTLRRMRQAMAYGQYTENLSLTFAEVARGFGRPQNLEGITDQHLPHPTDSHPPLHMRLDALGIKLEDVATDSLRMRPETSAISLFRDPDRIEVELTDEFHHQDLQETALI